MSLTLTPIASDNFTRANENPLSQGGNWKQIGSNLQLAVVSDLCQVASGGDGFGMDDYSPSALPADQYASATVLSNAAGGAIYISVRCDGTLVSTVPSGYVLKIQQSASAASLQLRPPGGSPSTLHDFAGLSYTNGDVWVLACVGTTIYVLQNSVQVLSITNSAIASGSSAAVYMNNNSSNAIDTQLSYFEVGSASTSSTHSISGNAGVASALVSYSGTASGNTTADGAGAYSISGLADGPYTITPSLAGYSFSPTSANETLAGSNIPNVNFTATANTAWSPVDSRKAKPNSATYRTINGAQIDDVQTSSNSAVPSTDSRKGGAPTASGEYPQNSRTAPPFKS